MKITRCFMFDTTASLRRELRNKKTNRWIKGAIWHELQIRRRSRR